MLKSTFFEGKIKQRSLEGMKEYADDWFKRASDKGLFIKQASSRRTSPGRKKEHIVSKKSFKLPLEKLGIPSHNMERGKTTPTTAERSGEQEKSSSSTLNGEAGGKVRVTLEKVRSMKFEIGWAGVLFLFVLFALFCLHLSYLQAQMRTLEDRVDRLTALSERLYSRLGEL